MKRTVCIGMLFALASNAVILCAQELVFNTQDFPPFSFMSGKTVAGPGVDIIKAVCEKAAIKYSIRLLPWTRAQQEVKDGNAHALFFIGWNKERAETFSFTPPILLTEYGVFTTTDSKLVYSTPEKLDGLLVGVYGPSNTSTSLDEIKKKVQGMKVDVSTNEETTFRKLSNKRVDAVYSNRDVGVALIANLKLPNIRYAGTDKPLKYYIGFSKQFADKSLVDRFINTYKLLYESGAIKKIIDSYKMSIAALE